MTRQAKLLARMRRSSRGDWRIEPPKAIADQHRIPYRQPGTGHVIFAPPGRNVLSVPAPADQASLVRQFVAMIDAIRADESNV